MKVGYTVGIGVDIVKSTRFERLLNKGDVFRMKLIERILHRKEREKFDQFKNFSTQVQYLTGSWASKEALYKTLDVKDQKKFVFNQWYRLHDENGKPYIKNDFYDQDEFHLSVSHDDSVIIATVLRQHIYNTNK